MLRALCHELLACIPEVALAAARPMAGLLALALPELRERLGPVVLADEGTGVRDDEVEAAACQWLLALTKRHSLVIAVDDIHSADAASLSLLGLLAQHASEHRLALVLSNAEGASSRAPLALSTLRRKATLVTLAPLDGAETAQLARSVFGDVRNVACVASYLQRLANGNPRTCMELAAHLVERDIARYERGGWLLPASLPEHELPTSLEHALAQRLHALAPAARELAAGLALSDTVLTLAEYRMLLGDDASALFAALDELVGAGVLVTHNEAYAFSQAGYVDAARRVIDEELHRRLRRRLSAILRQQDRPRAQSGAPVARRRRDRSARDTCGPSPPHGRLRGAGVGRG